VNPSLGSYLTGIGSLFTMLAPLVFGSYWLRRWIVPRYGGPLARLSELVLTLSQLFLVLELLGSFGELRRGWVVGSCVAAGLSAAALGWLKSPRSTVTQRPPEVPSWALGLAIVVAFIAVGEWSFPSQLDLHRGIFSGDSTWYHMPFAARFAQSHSTWNLLFTDPLALAAWFYPASSELLNSLGIIMFRSDWLSPLINIAWLGIGLLGAYCIGRPFGLGPATLVAAAIGLDSGVLLLTQAGEARNDAMGIALAVVFAALLAEGYRTRGPGPMVLAGLAGGLAVSVKLTILAPVATATLVAIMSIAFRGRSEPPWRAAYLVGADLLTGGYWYLRNFVHGGNPIPQVDSIGPLDLPHPRQMPLYPRAPISVAHYLFDIRVYRVWFLPKLREALGLFYPLILLMAFGAVVWAIAKLRDPILKALGLAALVTAAVYVVTPLTAAGAVGQPRGFLTNTRYLLPAIVLGMALVPLAQPLRASPRRTAGTLTFLSIVFAVTVASTGRWEGRFFTGSAFIAIAIVLVPSIAGFMHSTAPLRRPIAILLAISLLVPAVALGRVVETQYSRDHYTYRALRAQEGGGPDRIFAWARNLHNQRIALAGSGELFFDQGLFLGDDSSNWVQYIGISGPNGSYRVASSCAAFRGLINRGHYSYLVMTEFGDNAPNRKQFPLVVWAHSRALKRVRAEAAYPQKVYAYQVKGLLQPRACPAKGDPHQSMRPPRLSPRPALRQKAISAARNGRIPRT
jgi:hypothetical protein